MLSQHISLLECAWHGVHVTNPSLMPHWFQSHSIPKIRGRFSERNMRSPLLWWLPFSNQVKLKKWTLPSGVDMWVSHWNSFFIIPVSMTYTGAIIILRWSTSRIICFKCRFHLRVCSSTIQKLSKHWIFLWSIGMQNAYRCLRLRFAKKIWTGSRNCIKVLGHLVSHSFSRHFCPIANFWTASCLLQLEPVMYLVQSAENYSFYF